MIEYPHAVLSLWRGVIPTRATMALIAQDVANRTGVDLADLKSPSCRRVTVAARQEAYLAMRDAGKSYSEIGRFFARDHTTVILGVRRARERLSA